MNKALSFFVFCAAVSMLLLTSQAQAQYGAISTATAGSGRATIEPSESPTLNPASIAFTRGYFMTSDYGLLSNAQEFTVGLTDNLADTLVPASFVYNQVNGITSLKQNYATQDMHLQLANLVKKNFSFGLGLRSRTDTIGDNQFRQNNLMMGSIFALSQDLGVALVLDNLLGSNPAVPMDYRLLPSVAAGLNYTIKKVIRFRLDIETASNDSLNQPMLAFGLEGHWNQWLLFRMGANKSLETNTDEYGVGVGFAGPKFAIHYGYLMSPQDDSLDRQAIDFAIPIW